MKAHGIGVHNAEEIEEFGRNDLKVLSEMLDCKPFFFGDEPTTLDVVAFAVLSQLHFLSKDVSYPLRDFMTEKCPNLVGHVSRMKEKCFPDWDEICTKLDLNAHIPKPEYVKRSKALYFCTSLRFVTLFPIAGQRPKRARKVIWKRRMNKILKMIKPKRSWKKTRYVCAHRHGFLKPTICLFSILQSTEKEITEENKEKEEQAAN